MFRCSGSIATFFLSGTVPDPRTEPFLEALRNKRFRSIERSASAETSCGWVTPGDPSGESFALADMDLDLGIHMRMRVDKKTLPAVWMAIHRSAAEKTAGRKLSALEKRDLKQDLHSRLLPKVLPAVSLVDALFTPDDKRILLFTNAKGVHENFCKLFFATFGINLIAGDPYNLATRLGLSREKIAYLDQISPIPWRREADPVRPLAAEEPPEMAVSEL